MIKGIPLKLFDDEIVQAAKRRQIAKWPDPERFPLNFDGKRVEHQVQEDLKSSISPIIITGYTSLDYLIDFIAGLPADQPEKIRILLGSEPSSARRQDYSLRSAIFSQEVTDYWLDVGISLRLCHKIILFVEMIKGGRAETRYISDQKHKLHAKIYVDDVAVTLGSSNFFIYGPKKSVGSQCPF